MRNDHNRGLASLDFEYHGFHPVDHIDVGLSPGVLEVEGEVLSLLYLLGIELS